MAKEQERGGLKIGKEINLKVNTRMEREFQVSIH